MGDERGKGGEEGEIRKEKKDEGGGGATDVRDRGAREAGCRMHSTVLLCTEFGGAQGSGVVQEAVID